mgnify:CR=1 FL=1
MWSSLSSTTSGGGFSTLVGNFGGGGAFVGDLGGDGALLLWGTAYMSVSWGVVDLGGSPGGE